METYHKIQTLFKRDLDGSITGQKGKMIEGQWTTPELEYLAGNMWEFTEKVDGTNIRVGLTLIGDEVFVEFAGRSDNAVIPTGLMLALNELFPQHPTKAYPSLRESTVREWMVANDLRHVVLYGEGYGPKIQGGGKYRDDHSFVLFDVKIGDWWLNRDAVNDIARELGLDAVPVLGYGNLYDGIRQVTGRTEAGHYIFEEKGCPDPMRSQWGDFEAEGIVARPKVPMFDRKGQRIITKIKAVDFR